MPGRSGHVISSLAVESVFMVLAIRAGLLKNFTNRFKFPVALGSFGDAGAVARSRSSASVKLGADGLVSRFPVLPRISLGSSSEGCSGI